MSDRLRGFYNHQIAVMGRTIARQLDGMDVPAEIVVPAAASGGLSAGIEIGLRVALTDPAAAARLLEVVEAEALGGNPVAIATGRAVGKHWADHVKADAATSAAAPKGPVQ